MLSALLRLVRVVSVQQLTLLEGSVSALPKTSKSGQCPGIDTAGG